MNDLKQRCRCVVCLSGSMLADAVQMDENKERSITE